LNDGDTYSLFFWQGESSCYLTMAESNGHGSRDVGDVFGFRKAAYDTKTVAQMPVLPRDMYYNMTHKNRGQAIIFNHEHFNIDKLKARTGTEVDAKNLEATLISFGFEVQMYHNLDYRSLKRIVDKGKGPRYELINW